MVPPRRHQNIAAGCDTRVYLRIFRAFLIVLLNFVKKNFFPIVVITNTLKIINEIFAIEYRWAQSIFGEYYLLKKRYFGSETPFFVVNW